MTNLRAKPGRTLSNRPPEGEPWTWMTNTMYAAVTFRVLSISARRILDFLLFELGNHGGQENGNLAAPTAQLVRWGVTADDIPRGFAELIAAGFVDRTFAAPRVGASGEPSTYALTWLPTKDAAGNPKPPSHRWLSVTKQLAGDTSLRGLRQIKKWLKDQPGCDGRPWLKKQRSTPHLRENNPSSAGLRARKKGA